MLRGRTFNDRDTAAATPVVIISEFMAKKFWPKSDPMLDRILIGKGVMPQMETEQPRQIIGIVNDVRDGALNQDPGPGMYLPNAQVPDAIQALNVKLTPLAWVVKTRVEPMQLRVPVEEQRRQVSGLNGMEGVISSKATSRCGAAASRARMSFNSFRPRLKCPSICVPSASNTSAAWHPCTTCRTTRSRPTIRTAVTRFWGAC